MCGCNRRALQQVQYMPKMYCNIHDDCMLNYAIKHPALRHACLHVHVYDNYILIYTYTVYSIHTRTRTHSHITCVHTEIFSQLTQALEHLRTEEFTWDEDINFLQGFIRDPNLQALLNVNDGVANSQGFDQPVGPSREVTQEVS